eukprot:SAG31_NODE_28946_length_403_cov_0.680921_1_plen_78_part_10
MQSYYRIRTEHSVEQYGNFQHRQHGIVYSKEVPAFERILRNLGFVSFAGSSRRSTVNTLNYFCHTAVLVLNLELWHGE